MLSVCKVWNTCVLEQSSSCGQNISTHPYKYGIDESRVKSEGHLYLPIVFEYYGGMSDDAVDLNAAKCEYENKWVQRFSFQTFLWTTLTNIDA